MSSKREPHAYLSAPGALDDEDSGGDEPGGPAKVWIGFPMKFHCS